MKIPTTVMTPPYIPGPNMPSIEVLKLLLEVAEKHHIPEKVGNILLGTGRVKKAEHSAVSIFTKGLAEALVPVAIDLGTQLLTTVGTAAIAKLSQKLGITQSGDKVEDIGYRTIEVTAQPGSQKQENFASFPEYNNYLKKQVPQIDEEEVKKDKPAYELVGGEALRPAVRRKTGITISDDLMVSIERAHMDGGELYAVLQGAKSQGLTGEELTRYFQGTLAYEKDEALTRAIQGQMKAEYPDMTDEELAERIEDMKSAAQDDDAAHRLYAKEFTEKMNEAKKEED